MIDISTIFNKVETTFAVNACIELFGAMLVVFAVILTLLMRLEKGLRRLIVLAGLFTVMGAVGDAVAALFRGAPGLGARWAIVLGNFFGVFGMLWSAVFYANILYYSYKEVDVKTFKIFKYVSYVFCIIMTLVLIVSQFTGWLYIIDENNLYKRGPLFFLSAIYTMIYIECAIVYMVIRRRQSKNKVTLNAAFYILIPSIGILLQVLFYGGVFLQMSLFVLMLTILSRVQSFYTHQMIEQSEILSKKEIELAQARDQLLISQVSPHFIYNALSSIRGIKGNPEETKHAITEFANYIRGNLAPMNGKELIPFKDEISLVRDYIGLQQRRFPERFHIDFDLREEEFSVPPLTVQIIVENSIVHGILVRYETGHILVKSYKENNSFVIQVTDDGVGFDTTNIADSNRVGLRSVKNRLEYFLNGTLSIESEKDKGTSVTVRIPVK